LSAAEEHGRPPGSESAADAGGRARDSARLLPAVVIATSVGLLGSSTMPLMIGAVMDGLGVGAGRAGLIGSIELGAVAVVSLAIAPRVGRLPRRALAWVGAGVVAIGCLLSATAGSLAFLLGARLLSGLGSGAASAAGNAAAASSRDPDRLYAKMAILGGLAAAALLGLLHYALAPWGYRGGYLALAAVAVLCFPLLSWMPPAPGADSSEAGTPAPRRHLALPLLAALLLEYVCEDSIWVFSERIGLEAGLDLKWVSLTLSGTTVAGLLGAGVATVLGTRLGRTGPILLGISLSAAARFAVAYAETPAVYVAGLLLWGVAFFFTLPYLMGSVAVLDRMGRWSAAAAGMMTIGAGLAPGTAGLLVELAGYRALGWLSLGGWVLVVALILPALRGLAREENL
jgi:predicted MFS family arabinose efflux permease